MEVTETAADGNPVRTEEAMRYWLASKGLHVMPSETHGVNNCLIDSVLSALDHAGVMMQKMVIIVVAVWLGRCGHWVNA